MSAWAVLSMAGFYPVCPGVPEYVIGSPVFDFIKINMPSGNEFIIEAKNTSDENRYIQSAKLNGKALERAYLTHDEIINGGHLVLEMSSEPNKEWAVNEVPFSISQITE
jgi:putative alpha-1,2-mannosidase